MNLGRNEFGQQEQQRAFLLTIQPEWPHPMGSRYCVRGCMLKRNTAQSSEIICFLRRYICLQDTSSIPWLFSSLHVGV